MSMPGSPLATVPTQMMRWSNFVALAAGDDRVPLDDPLLAHHAHLLALAGGFHAGAHLEDDLLLALHHPGEVDLRLPDVDAEVAGPPDLAQQVGAGEQRLGGNASPVQARATKLGALEEHHVGAELRTAQRGDVTRRASAQDHDPRTHASPDFLGLVDAASFSGSRMLAMSACLAASVCEVDSAVVTIRSCSRWCEPADPSDGLARRGRPM